MSKQNLQNFYTLIQNSQELQAQLGAVDSPENFAETAVRLGAENGYSFSTDDVNTFINEQRSRANAELSEADLEAVAGGKGRSCPSDTRFTFCVLISSCWGSAC
ncbi:Nif11-like leader peptide family RiPP precursor [Nostoc sp. FACHB-145]|uniref:Nif11-like leader peptide family RiPP precursor n=1 Tax=Nostoc sp. FACHB-145 TaxID=2692836 RepID=UPI001683AAE0|nr:Nif11-like leader peptide family RiPP precursor [Nostoc sp. FACHB-145]MBD2466713.1 Nif11-like leader peptide family natural product precursor [Nostoc sp. FACHB-145]